ncbi:hypothetical protein DM860_003444 [Cuscuta australis]|uniref:Uncharacterized protein n=1 Tax=Cuscuta australis TaxID=267555 RepID=A0A328DFV8_9ASTE|nr:hypothetical protein DM860_003444 [Cuscuta australis]
MNLRSGVGGDTVTDDGRESWSGDGSAEIYICLIFFFSSPPFCFLFLPAMAMVVAEDDGPIDGGGGGGAMVVGSGRDVGAATTVAR